MSDKVKKVVGFALACLFVVCALGVSIETSNAATAPSWVANEPGTGFLPVYDSAVGDVRIRVLEVTATAADCKFSVWYYKAGWVKSHPLNGAAAADTVIVVPANSTKAYVFGAGVDALYVSSGDAFFAGE